MEDRLKELMKSLTCEEQSNILIDSLKKILVEVQCKTTMTIKEAAEYTGIGNHKIRELVDKRNTDFPFFKVGNKTLIDKQLLDGWILQISKENREI